MYEVLKSIAKKVLFLPYIGGGVEKFCRLVAIVRFEKGLDALEGASEFHGILGAGPLDIKEQLTEGDAKGLEKLIDMVIKDNIMVVEIGSWKGFSTSILAKSVANYQGSVFAVDHWMGNEETQSHDVARNQDIYSIFKRNMISLGVWDVVHPLVMDSQTAAGIFADGILDLVFIDADHRYENVKQDILTWLPKLKVGGVLCGHDCEGYYSQYPPEVKKMIDEHLADDYITGICHPGVVKALHNCFQEGYSIMPNSIVWYYVKKYAG